MKERPILFSGPMVRAILDGKKTQTRRIVRPLRGAPFPMSDLPWRAIVHADGFAALIAEHAGGETAVPLPRSPYGVPGDRLWVRERWAAHDTLDDLSPQRIDEIDEDRNIWYAVDGDSGWGSLLADPSWRGRWRPSIHMPRWASRIDLDVTTVRVERLQAITEDDARAEGVEAIDGMYDEAELCRIAKEMRTPATDARVWYRWLWDEINGDRAPWASNPWVWVVEFARVDGGAK